MTTMIALVGEQPIPNLLPVRSVKPDALVLVFSRRTMDVARRLQELLRDTETLPLKIADPYDIARTRDRIGGAVTGRTDLLFNLTGGTKIMVLAAYDLAAQTNSPILYFQTENPGKRDQQSALYRYVFRDAQSELEERTVLTERLIDLDDYLCAHFGGYTECGSSRETGGDLERAVHNALKSIADEIKVGVRPSGVKDQIEIDLVIQCGNQIGFIEVKSGGRESGKKAVDQLTTAGARELSGIYSARFLVTGTTNDEQYKAAAGALNVSVVELRDWRGRGALSARDAQWLRRCIADRLPCRPGA